jgi:hypothetical protein
MRVLIEVDGRRQRLGWLTALLDDGSRLGPVEVCLTADETAARAAGNPERDPLRPGGHAPFGTYRLREVRGVPQESRDEYGRHSLIFEPRSGEALQAESFGRLALALHGGAPGEDGRLRPTDGGFRVDDGALQRIAKAVRPGDELEVKERPLGFWEWLFGRRRRPSAARSERPTDDHDRGWIDRSTGPTSERSPDRGEPFEGRGGAFGGAGASGAWDAAPRADASAAGAAVAGGVIAAGLLAGDAPSGEGGEPPGSTTGSGISETTTTY